MIQAKYCTIHYGKQENVLKLSFVLHTMQYQVVPVCIIKENFLIPAPCNTTQAKGLTLFKYRDVPIWRFTNAIIFRKKAERIQKYMNQYIGTVRTVPVFYYILYLPSPLLGGCVIIFVAVVLNIKLFLFLMNLISFFYPRSPLSNDTHIEA